MRCVARHYVPAIALAVVILTSPSLQAGEAFFCNGGCVCIYWSLATGEELEIRCRDDGAAGGWATGVGQPSDGSGGSWDGTGRQKSAPSPLPEMVLNPVINARVSAAKTEAQRRLRGERVDKGQWLPNRCTDLFADSPLGLTGAQMFAYMVFRDGTGVKDGKNVDVCATGTVSAWTKCCEHDPVVFICPSKFGELPPDETVIKLIHEAMHVAGQLEDKNGSVGPGDPPNTGQIDDVVRKACP